MNESVLTVQACTFLAVSGLTYLAFRGIWSFDKRVRQRLEGLRHGHVLCCRPSPRRRRPARAEKPARKSCGLPRGCFPTINANGHSSKSA